MKMISAFFVLFLLVFNSQAALGAPPALAVYAASPDHPHTWVSGADNVRQALRWDDNRQMLVADVKYSTVAYADDTHPTEENDYTLTFPTVRFDRTSGKFTAHGTTVAMLHHGLFGVDIVLNRDVELSIHRHHGRIFGQILQAEETGG
jgi:hypothetical protein